MKTRIAMAVTAALAASVVAATSLVQAQQSASVLTPAGLAEAQGLLDRYVAEKRIAGAVAGVSRTGRREEVLTAGVQDLASGTPMTPRSLFRIYSMTKSVTSVAAMMLFEEGRFSLDDPVSKFIPEFAKVTVAANGTTRPASAAITVRDLLLHTSGLNHRTSEIYRREQVRSREITMQRFIENLVRVPLMEDPGTRYRYSEGTSVVGRLVEIWSGKPFDAFLDERIFKPLRMTDTSFWAASPDARARLTTVYAPSGTGGLSAVELETIPFTERPTLIEGAVGLLSTVPDYMRLAEMLLNRGELNGVRLLKPETVDMMTSNGLSAAVQQARGGSMGWGLGNVNVLLAATGQNASSHVGEYGWDGTAGTIFWVDPTAKTVIVLMTQSSPANPDGIRQRFKTAVLQGMAP
jgi:CubicO group peptidase (beta-lactamase class C family)